MNLHFSVSLSTSNSLVPCLFPLAIHTGFEHLPTHSSTGELSCYRERPLCHSLFRVPHLGGGLALSHCTWLIQGPCLLEAMVKETLYVEASTDLFPKLRLGPLAACLTGGVVGVWKLCKPIAVAQYRDERSWPWKVQRQFPPLSTPTSFSSSLPARQPLLPFPNFLYSFSMLPLFLIFHTSPYLKCICLFILFYSYSLLVSCLLQVSSSSTGSTALKAKNLTRQALSFTAYYCMWGVYHVNTSGMTSEKIMLKGSGCCMCLVLLILWVLEDPGQKQKENIISSPNSVTVDKA